MPGYEDDCIMGSTFAEMQQHARDYMEYVNGGWSTDTVPQTMEVTIELIGV